jgi:hypothetical protein
MGCLFGYPAGGGDLPDRLVVDLDRDGQAKVLSWRENGLLPEEVSRAPQQVTGEPYGSRSANTPRPTATTSPHGNT